MLIFKALRLITVNLLSVTETFLGSSMKKRLSSLFTGAPAAGAAAGAAASPGAALAPLSERKSQRWAATFDRHQMAQSEPQTCLVVNKVVRIFIGHQRALRVNSHHKNCFLQTEFVTFHSDLALAEVTAGRIAGFAEVISCVSLWHWTDLQTGLSTDKCDSGISTGFQFPPVLHPLDGKWRRATDVAFQTQLLALVHCYWLQRDVDFGSLTRFWRSDGK